MEMYPRRVSSHDESATNVTDHEGDDYQGGTIFQPQKNDVLLGRGGKNGYHSGNETLRKMAQFYGSFYMMATKPEKPLIAAILVQSMRQLDPPGRFLKKDVLSSTWREESEGVAREKASQCLRDTVAAVMRGKVKGCHGETSKNPFQAGIQLSAKAMHDILQERQQESTCSTIAAQNSQFLPLPPHEVVPPALCSASAALPFRILEQSQFSIANDCDDGFGSNCAYPSDSSLSTSACAANLMHTPCDNTHSWPNLPCTKMTQQKISFDAEEGYKMRDISRTSIEPDSVVTKRKRCYDAMGATAVEKVQDKSHNHPSPEHIVCSLNDIFNTRPTQSSFVNIDGHDWLPVHENNVPLAHERIEKERSRITPQSPRFHPYFMCNMQAAVWPEEHKSQNEDRKRLKCEQNSNEVSCVLLPANHIEDHTDFEDDGSLYFENYVDSGCGALTDNAPIILRMDEFIAWEKDFGPTTASSVDVRQPQC